MGGDEEGERKRGHESPRERRLGKKMTCVTILLAALGQGQGMDEAIRGWAGNDLGARDAASLEVVRRWKEWTPDDLAKLARAAKDTDGEVAARAGEAQAQVLRRRGFGEKFWPKIEKADALLARLRAGEQQSGLMGWGLEGSPMFNACPLTRELLAFGDDVEPYLRPHLADPAVRSEIAIVLSQIGGTDSLPALIDAIPAGDGFSYSCVVYALWRLTNQPIGYNNRIPEGWSADVQARWRRWYEDRKHHLYGTSGSVSLDVEAWALGKSTKGYRKDHPWIPFDEIKEPKDGAEYERRLREYCVSYLLRSLWGHGRFDTDVLRVLGEVDDPRALAAIRRLSREPADPNSTVAWLAGALRRKVPETLPDLERLLAAATGRDATYVRRSIALAKLDQKLGPNRLSGRVEADFALLLQECLEGRKGIPDLVGKLNAAAPDAGLIEIAGFVNDERVKAALEAIRDGRPVDSMRRMAAATALGRSGDLPSIDLLREGFGHEHPFMRLEAAESLWRLSNRQGFRALVSLLELRPIDASTLPVIRRSCELLGEMGDRRAIEPLKKLLSENLNGFSVGKRIGAGYYGRPDIVALARLGDLSGMEQLLAWMQKGDPLGAAGDYGRSGDLVEIGLRRYARDLVPLLADTGHERKSLYAARAILTLLDRGK